MKHPLSMPEIRQIEGYNKTIVDEIITWDGTNNTVYVDVPLTRMLVPTVIAVKSTPAVSLSLEHYFADEEAQSSVIIGEEDGGQVTITAADEGDLGYTVQVVLPEPAESGEATDLAVDFDEETGVLTITLALDETGEPDAAKNTAAAICAEAFENGLVIETSGNHSQVVKCLCPLIISEEQIDKAMTILDAAFAKVMSADVQNKAS